MIQALNLDNKILYISNYQYKYFLSKPNVIGVGLGYKVYKGFCTYKKCIKILVTKKVAKSKLFKKDIIPKFFHGILTDVIESGQITASSFTNRIRPVFGGYSVGPFNKPVFGTMGCLVSDGNYFYVLSSNHVLAYENTVTCGTAITQPSLFDSGTVPKDTIGNLSKFIPINFITKESTPENYIDCAIAKVNNKEDVTSKLIIIGNLEGTNIPIIGGNVKKVGRTSEFTMGKILSLGTTVNITFTTGKCLFKNQITTTLMSKKGDSGSILVDNTNRAVGLLMGDSSTLSFFNPINKILDSLNVTIVTKD